MFDRSYTPKTFIRYAGICIATGSLAVGLAGCSKVIDLLVMNGSSESLTVAYGEVAFGTVAPGMSEVFRGRLADRGGHSIDLKKRDGTLYEQVEGPDSTASNYFSSDNNLWVIVVSDHKVQKK